MASATETFQQWLNETLASGGIEDTDVFCEYVTGLLDDELLGDERAESIRQLLEATAVDEKAPADWDAFVASIVSRHAEAKAAAAAEAAAAAAASQGKSSFEQALEVLAVKPEDMKKFVPLEDRVTDPDELARRKRLLEQYELVADADEVLDDDGNPVPIGSYPGGSGPAVESDDDTAEMFKNVNALAFVDAQKAQREAKAKAEAEARTRSKQAQKAGDLARAERKELSRNKKANERKKA